MYRDKDGVEQNTVVVGDIRDRQWFRLPAAGGYDASDLLLRIRNATTRFSAPCPAIIQTD